MKKYIQIVVGIAISLAAIAFPFIVGWVKFADLWAAVVATNWWIAAVATVVIVASFYWRVFRWRILLAPVKDIPSHRLFGPMMVGFGFNNILPMRAGEFARPLALMKQEKVSYAAAFSTQIVERLTDMIVLLALLVAMPLYITLDPSISMEFDVGGTKVALSVAWIDSMLPKFSVFALVLLCGIGSFLVPPVKKLYIRAVRAVPFFAPAMQEKIVAVIESFTKGFDSLKSPRAVAMVSLHSVIVWLALAFGFQVFSWGFPGASMTFQQAVAFLLVTSIAVSLPSSPGFWGVYEFGGMFALVLMGVVTNDAAGMSAAFAFTLVVHFLQWAPTTVFGLMAAAKLSISAGDAEALAEQSPKAAAEAPSP